MGVLKALAAGEPVLDQLNELVKGKARKRLEPIRLALEVPLTPSQRWELTFQLARLARIERRDGRLWRGRRFGLSERGKRANKAQRKNARHP